MASTSTDIANNALRAIGSEKITDLTTDTTIRGIRLQDLYNDVVLKLLRRGDWWFAQRRASLTEDTAAPLSGWENQYPLPTDFVRMTSVSPYDSDRDRATMPYALGVVKSGDEVSPDDPGRKLYCNSSTVYIVYVYAQTGASDPALWTADFAEAVAQELGYRMIKAGVKSSQSAQEQRIEARRALAVAMSTEGIEDYPKELAAGSWVTERYT
jgi:hypothetical protein